MSRHARYARPAWLVIPLVVALVACGFAIWPSVRPAAAETADWTATLDERAIGDEQGLGRTISYGDVFVVPTTIDSTGTREVSAELQHWLVDTVRSGTPDRWNVIQFQPNGTYWVDYTLVLRIRDTKGGLPQAMWKEIAPFELSWVKIDLNGSTLDQRTTTVYRSGTTVIDARKRWGDPMLLTNGASGIELTNGTLHSSNEAAAYVAAREDWPLVKLSGNRDTGAATDIWIHHMNLRHTWADFVYIAAATAAGDQLINVVIEDNAMALAGRQGIVLNGGTDVVIRRNDLRNIAHMTFDSEPTAAQGWHRVVIASNTGHAGYLGYFNYAAPSASFGQDLVIQHNTITSGNLKMKITAPLDAPRFSASIHGNVNLGTKVFVTNPMWPVLIKVTHWSDVHITGNVDVVNPNGRTEAVDVSTSTDTTVTGNTFVNAIDQGATS